MAELSDHRLPLRTGAMVVASLLACLCLPARAVMGARQTAAADADNPPDPKSFVGTWTAKFEGQPLAKLILSEKNGKLSGSLNDFDLEFDKDGNLADGTHADVGDAPLLNIHFKSGTLFFTVIEKDQYRPASEWKFVPLNADEGELTPLLEHREDVPKDLVAKPIRLHRAKTTP
jgi:hypothetical protein